MPGVDALSALGGGKRKFFVGGNWKMNGTKDSINTICSWLSKGPLDPACEVVVGVQGLQNDELCLGDHGDHKLGRL